MQILYVDMDNVLVDFPSGIARVPSAVQAEYKDRLDEVPGIFSLMDPMPNAIESTTILLATLTRTSSQQHHGTTLPHGLTNCYGFKNILVDLLTNG